VLTSLTVENWKSFKKATLNIDALTVLIGTNASGKSNLLEALVFLNRTAHGATLTAALRGDGGTAPLRGGLEWAAHRPGDCFAIGVTFGVDRKWEYSYRIACVVRENRCDLVEEELNLAEFDLNANNERKPGLGHVRNLFKTSIRGTVQLTDAELLVGDHYRRQTFEKSYSIAYQLLSQRTHPELDQGVRDVMDVIKGVFVLDPIPNLMRGFSSLSYRLEPDGGNIAGVIAALSANGQPEIANALTGYASKLPELDVARVYAETVGKFNTDAMLYCDEQFQVSGKTSTVDARTMSDGTLRFLAILTALLTRPAGSLLVIEDVDNGLHPSRSETLLNMLRTVGQERGIDILVTTHNPALLDAMGTEMVPFITVAHRDPASGASELTLLEDIKQLPKLLAHGRVGRLSSEGALEKALRTPAEQAA
jgi:ABC-type lipoprotein export system ATPase subunit